jgi:predicted transcriptional regulator
MSSGLESLHKVLKDEKRRKIVLLLSQRGNLSYTDLMRELGISSTGKINYHLKVLNDLIEKQGDGQYILTEKGKLAVKLLDEFGERKSQAQADAPFTRGYMIVVSLFTIAVLSLDFAFYLSGVIAFDDFVLYTATAVLAVVFLVAAEKARVKRSTWQPNRQMLGAAISIIAAGAFAGAVLLFFGGGFLIGGLAQIGLRNPFHTFTSWIITSFTIGSIFGGFAGYLIYKRSRYSKASYYNPFAT